MHTPHLFVYLPQPSEASLLDVLTSTSKTLSETRLTWFETPASLLTACETDSPDWVVLDVDDKGLCTNDLLVMMETLTHTQWVLLTDGIPLPAWNHRAQDMAATVFRRPIDKQAFHSLFIERIHRDSGRPSKGKPVVTSQADQYGYLLGASSPMLALYRQLQRLGPTNANVFIVGESGVGKEHVAKTLHSLGRSYSAGEPDTLSQKIDSPFMAVNCGALSPELIESELFGHVKGAFTGAHQDHQGIFYQAEGGTVFLDEITEMPQSLQVKLLRVLESGEYRPVGSTHNQKANVRLLAATNRDALQAIREGKLREDIYYRLAQFVVTVPVLRERGDDIGALTTHFLAELNHSHQTQVSISTQALDTIKHYHWPGNVRELKHAIEHGFLLSHGCIEASDLPANVLAGHQPTAVEALVLPESITLAELEKVAILQALVRYKGNRQRTATVLGISPKTLYNKLQQYQDLSSDSSSSAHGGERIESD
ncbi:sigma-54-dependent Fis family transcriptional regulator [Salinivibrio sp. ES.052]|uniref:sigma-54 interaction domain-containing protein n=1 Tax=Salinivibrio sp. ES.052 TaxID=1882823 RepID=UPI00092BF961|nr:sigma-54 dependent transcriptional regulator [Salinivibrio sp. ES.052]SIO36103.1 sigma54 specific transcriptional regulator, Fis family [Salinivibrio sp. ES.052]